MNDHPKLLKVNGNQIQDGAGNKVILRGVGLGGWMNMENFVTGFPANESAFRAAIQRILGDEKADYFFDRYLAYFFTDQDAAFIRSVGLNHVRLPFNYHHFEDDLHPTVLRESGFTYLDRAIQTCAQQEIYTILDLHAAPGYQNQDWHSDNPSRQAFFWQHKHFQDRVVWLWETLAERYRGNPWVAGYDLLNEPSDPDGKQINGFYRRLVSAIRRIDPDHIIFLEGNRFSRDFFELGDPMPNVVYALHNYAVPGFIDGSDYPGYTRGVYYDRSVLQQQFMESCQYMFENNTPIWVGEFGPVYLGEREKDCMRYQILRDQLSTYRQMETNWSLWTYKDIGLHGMVELAPDSPWLQKIQPLLEKKALLGVDSWGGTDKNVRHILEPIEQTFAEFFPNYKPPAFDARWQINRAVRHILLAEPLMDDFYTLLAGIDFNEIDALMASFKFENCRQRLPLIEILKAEQQIVSKA
jgi:endoglucanase